MLRKYFEGIVEHLKSIFDTESSGRLMVFAPVVGIVAGLGAAAFFSILNFAEEFALGQIEGYYPPAAGDEVAHHIMQLPTNSWAVVAVQP